MLSRVCSRQYISQVAAGCTRYYATSAKATPPKPATPPPQQAAPLQTGNPSPKAGAPKGFDFLQAQEKLPLKLYHTSGVLASFIFAEAEHSGKAEVDKVGQSLADLYNELAAHPTAKECLLTPSNTKAEKHALVNALSKGLKLHPLVVSFTNTLIDQGIIRQYPKMVEDYNNLLRARDNQVDVKVTLFAKDQPKPKPETVRSLLGYDSNAKINLSIEYDPRGAILAGPDRILDLSFQRELTALRESLEKEAVTAKASKRAKFQAELAKYGDNLA